MKDNAFKELFKKFTDMVYVNFLWIAASFLGLLLTTGAATTAMFRVSFQILNKDEPTNVWQTFFQSFRENFVFSTLVWIALVVLAVPLYMMYFYALNQNLLVLMLVAIVCGYQLLVFTLYFFPILSIFKTKSNKTLIKNVVLLSNMSLWTNFKVIGSLVFIVLLIVFVHITFILMTVGLYGVLVVFHLKKILKPYLEQFEFEMKEDNQQN
ncbi:MAG: DUF624 domain-containing protein [Acholeplasmataceae bacterium]|nr:DUF624 domain-containing protein [Acholeplasmataceae bacterium]